MANTTIQINTNPTSDPQYAGGSVVLPPADSVIDITPINENAQALTNAVNQLFWDVNQGGGSTNAQIDINRQNIGAASGQLLPDGNLQSQVNTVKSRVSTLENFVGDSTYNSGLAKMVSDQGVDIQTNANNITALGTQLNTTNGNVSANTTQISNIKNAVGINNSGQLTPTVSGTLAKQVADNTTGIQTNTTNIGNVSSALGQSTDASTDPTAWGGINKNKDTLLILGGGSLPTTSVDTQIQDYMNLHPATVSTNSVFTDAIQDNAVTTPKIAYGAITNSQLGFSYESLSTQPADWSTNYTDYYTVYTVLASQPADWSTDYTNYYSRTGSGTQADPYVYTNISSGTAPTFVANTYYEYDIQSVSGGSAPAWVYGNYYYFCPAVKSDNIGNGEVKAVNIDNDAISTNNIVDNSITYSKLDNSLKATIDSDHISSRSNYSSSYVDTTYGTVSYSVGYTQYSNLYTELFTTGSATTYSLTSASSSEIIIPLGSLGIALSSGQSISFSGMRVEFGNIVLGVSGSTSDDVCTTYSLLQANAITNLPEVHFIVNGLDSSKTYTIKQFAFRLCGNFIAVTPQ